MRNIVKILLLIIIASTLSFNCRVLYDVADNISANFGTPKKVVRINEPIKDSVRLSALWVGHATVLIQIYDKVILTDPFLTNNIALLQKRIQEPGIDIDKIDKIDIVTISHSHFDHCNLGSLSIINDKFTDTKLVFCEGMEEYLPNLDIEMIRIKRADESKNIYIGDTKTIDEVKITSVAAYHWGGRYGLDGLIWGSESYCGYIIQYKDVIVYFSGDTAYDENFFKYLGDKYKIDLALIPIGPCSSCYEIHKENRHVYPAGALKIMDETKPKIMIPIHYGTIREKSEPMKPKYVLQELINNKPHFKEHVKILNIGEQLIIPN